MSRNREEPFYKILEVAEDKISFYAKIEVSMNSKVKVIRCGLDRMTYNSLKKACSIRYFDNMPGVMYEYYLLASYTVVNNNCTEPSEIKTVLNIIVHYAKKSYKAFVNKFNFPKKKRNEKRLFFAFLEIVCGKKWKNIEFSCSELFAGNLSWLQKIRAIEDLEYLEWGKNIK